MISLEQNKAVIEEVTKMINFANNLIWDFEKDSDRRISAICRALAVLTIVVILLNMLHVFKISTALYPTLIVSAVILLMPTLFYDILNLHSKFIRYFVLTLLKANTLIYTPGV